MDTTQNTGTPSPAPHRHRIETPHDRWMMAGTCTGLAVSAVLILSIYFVHYPGLVRLAILLSSVPMMMFGALTATAAHAVYSRVAGFLSGRFW